MKPEEAFHAMLLAVLALFISGLETRKISTLQNIQVLHTPGKVNKLANNRKSLVEAKVANLIDAYSKDNKGTQNQVHPWTGTNGQHSKPAGNSLRIHKKKHRNHTMLRGHRMHPRSVQQTQSDNSTAKLPLPIIDSPNAEAVQSQCPTKRCHCLYNTQFKRPYINCRYQQLQYIPSFTLVDILYYELTFSEQNYITKLEYLAFRNLKVERINLLKNKLEVIQPGAFFGLEQYLKELYMEGDGNMQVPYDKITSLRNLRRLRFDNFVQDSISQTNYFAYFPDLEALQMYKIKTLATIHAAAFENKLKKLHYLDFVEVGFTQIPVESLNHLSSLTNLCIRESKISTVYSRSFEKLQNLQVLDLSHNRINTLQVDAFMGISRRLTYLNLGFNSIRTDSVTALSSKLWESLQTLTLSYNTGLEHMPDNVFKNMPKLQYLNLIEINLKQISRNLLSGLTNLYMLDLSWNKVSFIQDGAFIHKPNLYEVRLNRQFDTFGSTTPQNLAMELTPLSFAGLQNSLVHLNLEYTPLKPQQLWSAIKPLSGLQELIISKTNMKIIPDFAFLSNINLKKIELNENEITHLPDAAFEGLENTLNKLSLQTNNLTTISQCAFKNFTQLDYIHMIGNPLHCDCRIKWLKEFITEKSEAVEYFPKEEFKCATPIQHKDMFLYKIPTDQLTCTSIVDLDCMKMSTPVTTEKIPTTTKSLSTTKPSPTNSLKLSEPHVAIRSATLSWAVDDPIGIARFKLVYYPTVNDLKSVTIYISNTVTTYTVDNLQPGTFYRICVTAETAANIKDTALTVCRIIQTRSNDAGDSETYTTDEDEQGRNNNIIIGLVIVSVVLVLLAGLYMLVKYKMEKLKTLRLTMGSRVVYNANGQRCTEDGKIFTVENEYSEIGATKDKDKKIADSFQGYSTKTMQRQFGMDNSGFDNGYNTYQKIHPKRKNPYENDDSDDNLCESDEVAYKHELELRHSAPSRLNVRPFVPNSPDSVTRPLPATPADKAKTLDRTTKGDNKPSTFVTQVSVYENRNNAVVKKDSTTSDNTTEAKQ